MGNDAKNRQQLLFNIFSLAIECQIACKQGLYRAKMLIKVLLICPLCELFLEQHREKPSSLQKVPIIIVIWKTNLNTFQNSLNTHNKQKMKKFLIF